MDNDMTDMLAPQGQVEAPLGRGPKKPGKKPVSPGQPVEQKKPPKNTKMPPNQQVGVAAPGPTVQQKPDGTLAPANRPDQGNQPNPGLQKVPPKAVGKKKSGN